MERALRPSHIALLLITLACIGIADLAVRSGHAWWKDRQLRHADPVYRAFGDCGIPCRIVYNGGGDFKTFQEAALAIATRNLPLVVDGPCLSGCAIVADMLRPLALACVTPAARFAVHEIKYVSGRAYDHRYTSIVAAWIKAQGPFKDGEWRVIPSSFWDTCTIENFIAASAAPPPAH